MKAFAAVLLLLAVPASADFCDLNLRYENGRVTWNEITGATNYTVLATYGALRPPFYFTTKNNYFDIEQRASAAVEVRYVVTAEIEPGVRVVAPGVPAATATEDRDACTGTVYVVLDVDPEFRKFTRRAVVPLVGSTEGATGATFRTALELRGTSQERGRIVFHPVGLPASDDDPSIPYSFAASRVLKWNDIVAAIGQTGIGSLDIMPDEEAVDLIPRASVYHYNDLASGTFGTFMTPLLPFDYLHAPGIEVSIPEEQFRLNIGIRALTETRMEAIVRRADGRLDGRLTRTFPAGTMQMNTASNFVGKTLNPGDSVTIAFDGAAIPFYTITENATDDPTMVIPFPNGPSRNVGKFVD